MSGIYKNPQTPLVSLGTSSVPNGSTYGSNFSVYGIGGFMEVYKLTDLVYTIPVGQTGIIEYSGNTIPIRFQKGSGSVFSPDVLTLNSDNISSGRRRLGMLVYVYETDKIYQFNIENYDTLWNNATGATGPGGSSVIISDFGTTIKNNSVAGQALINAWTGSTIEGVTSGVTGYSWTELKTGGSSGGSNFTGGTVTGGTIFTNGLTANTISATTYYNLPVSGLTEGTNISITGSNGNYRITFTGTTGSNFTGGTVSGDTIFTSGLTANTLNVTGNTILSSLSATTISGSGIGLNNIPISGVTNLQSELNNKFDKTGGTVNGSVVVTGNVTILGTATTINTDTLLVKDNIIAINSNYTGNTAPFFGNSGLEVLRGSATTATLLWEESNGYWTAGLTGNTKQIILSGDSLSLLNSGHTHPISEIVDLQSNLNKKLETSGGTINGDLNVTNSLTATTFYGNGSNLTGISKGGGGGGQLYYFNISNTQTPYYEFSTSATSATEQSITATTGASQTAYIGGFMTPSNLPNVTDLPAGITSFYIHLYTDNISATFNLYCEFYKRTIGGTETLLLTSDPIIVVGTSPTMYVTDTFFSGTSLNITDRLVVKVYATNTSLVTRSIIMLSEGNEHYSFSYTTIPTFIDTYVTGFTYSNNTLTIKQNNNQPDYTQTINQVTGLTINGDLNVTGNTTLNSLSANTISATTYFNLPVSGLTGGNNIGITNNNSNHTISFTGGVVTATTIFNNGLTSNTLNVTGVTILDGTTASTLNVTGNTILSAVTASTISATSITASVYNNLPYPNYITTGSSGTYSLKTTNGSNNDAIANYALSFGYNTIASGVKSHAEGGSTVAGGQHSHTEGYLTSSSFFYQWDPSTEGYGYFTSSNQLIITGYNYTNEFIGDTDAIVINSNDDVFKLRITGTTTYSQLTPGISGTTISFSGGDYYIDQVLRVASTTTVGDFSHAEGYQTYAGGLYSHTEGVGSQALGESSHAEGTNTFATGNTSHAEGGYTVAGGIGSHSEGVGTQALGDYSHAEGSFTIATGDYSHAEGDTTQSIGRWSYAGGRYTTSSGEASFVHGSGSTALGKGTVVFGSNITGTTDYTAYFERGRFVGSGTSSPILVVSGSVGELLSVNDTLTADIFNVVDSNSNPILQVYSGNVVTMGYVTYPSYNTSTGITVSAGLTNIISVPTGYTNNTIIDSVFIDYSLRSTGVGARAGNIMVIQNGSTVEYTETSTNDIIGTTSGVTFSANTSGGYINLYTSATTGDWLIKVIVRAI
jgi:hypothetical protein